MLLKDDVNNTLDVGEVLLEVIPLLLVVSRYVAYRAAVHRENGLEHFFFSLTYCTS